MKQPELGQKLIELRQQRNMTQEELVEACNVSVRTIQRIESGEVTPRLSTVKILLSALEVDIEEFKEKTRPTKSAEYFNSLQSWLQVAWIAGIVYFVVGFIDGALEVDRYESGDLDVSPIFYIPMKLLYFISYTIFIYGFIRLSDFFNNYLLKISSYIMIGLFAFITILDIASLYIDISDANLIMIGVGESMSVGVIGILLGIGLMRLQDGMGILAKAAGIIEIIAGACFLLVVGFLMGYIMLIPAIILEVILLFKGYEYIKSERLKTL
ncbi:helix-turn-helix transcriptional regulator [Ekhidna sp.]|uniref:helix-turn-helix domain-containing protein n=1 Tax=Ekhidna sp. TaxID=2608089 RepID=UPI0032EC363F